MTAAFSVLNQQSAAHFETPGFAIAGRDFPCSRQNKKQVASGRGMPVAGPTGRSFHESKLLRGVWVRKIKRLSLRNIIGQFQFDFRFREMRFAFTIVEESYNFHVYFPETMKCAARMREALPLNNNLNASCGTATGLLEDTQWNLFSAEE